MTTFFKRPGDVAATQPDRGAVTERGNRALEYVVGERKSSVRAGWKAVWRYRQDLVPYLQLGALDVLSSLNNVLLIPLFTLLGCELVVGFQPPEAHALYLAVSLCFLGEWAIGLVLARSRRAYLANIWLLADLLSSLPLTAALQSLRLTRVARLVRFVRVLHLFRARRFPFPFGKILQVGLVGLAVAFAGAIALAATEPGTVDGLGDAVWWSLVTMTTVGYGDIAPATSAGRGVAAVLMITGVGVFGYLAGLMANGLFDPQEEAMLDRLIRLEAKVDRLLDYLGDGSERP